MDRRSSAALAGIAPMLTVAGMIATPLVRRGGGARRVLSSVVVGGLFASTTTAAARRWGPSRAVAAAGTVAAATTAVEHVGTRTGLPFGRYHYTPALQPKVAGVPVLVPMAWFAMALPAREAAHAALGDRSNVASRIAVGAVAMTAWDLFLDPQMVGEGYWRWARPGRYRGIPLGNYVGWLLTSIGVMGVLEVALPATDRADPALVGEYALMGAMETVGFARWFGDRVVAAAGGVGMLPLATLAVVRVIADRGRRTGGAG